MRDFFDGLGSGDLGFLGGRGGMARGERRKGDDHEKYQNDPRNDSIANRFGGRPIPLRWTIDLISTQVHARHKRLNLMAGSKFSASANLPVRRRQRPIESECAGARRASIAPTSCNVSRTLSGAAGFPQYIPELEFAGEVIEIGDV